MPSANAARRNVGAIIPSLDEEDAIAPCVAAVLAHGLGEVIVVDGQSADRTAERAAAAGAKVVIEPARGYGRAMMSGWLPCHQPAQSCSSSTATAATGPS